jgi:hypothetical protein
MKKTLIFGTLIGSLVLLTGCTQQSAQQPSTAVQPSPKSATAKTGDTTKTGKIIKASGKFFLQETGKQPAEIDSYTLDLDSYVSRTVKVTGQYSGDTLFIGKIE